MAELDIPDEDKHCSISSIMANLHSYFEDPVNNLISQIQSMRTREMFSLEISSEQEPEGLDDSLDLPDHYSPPTDIYSVVRTMALMRRLDWKRINCAPDEVDSPLPQLDDEDEITERAADQAEEEVSSFSFQSKYFNFFPLYQDYCVQEVRDDLHRLNKSLVSELVTPQLLQGVQSCVISLCCSRAPSPQPNRPEALQASTPPHPVRVTPSTLWQDLEEVKASGLLSSLTCRQIRLQETMFELIGSEASYLRSLGVTVNHFRASMALKQTLNKMEHHVLFSNIQDVMAASEKFLMDLEMRLGESVFITQVGDIVLQHCSEFHSLYVPYVTNMMYQESLVNQLLQQNRDFQHCIKKLESDPVCQKRSLKSFLVLPFQRITRIKLILESILKLTEPDSDSVSNLEKAIEAIHEIVTECDKGVQRMKQIEELIYLEMLLDFGRVKSVPLVISGRFLVHQGPMRQLSVEDNSRQSLLSIYLHLFNDLLIISSKRAVRFSVVDHAEFPTHVRVRQLKTEVLGLPPDCFLLHLLKSHTGQPIAMILVAYTRSDKEAWMKVLNGDQNMILQF